MLFINILFIFYSSSHFLNSWTPLIMKSSHSNTLSATWFFQISVVITRCNKKFKKLWCNIDRLTSSFLFGPSSNGGSYKITFVRLSVCLSSACLPVCLSEHQFAIFLKNGSLFFLIFCTVVDNLIFKNCPIFLENSFLPKFGQESPKMDPQIGFLDFLKNFVIGGWS